MGVSAVFSAGYGNVGSSIYYALGIVALAAIGATPIALGAAGILFIFTAFTYAEGTAMLPEAGGSASFARHGFGNAAGFTAGWALRNTSRWHGNNLELDRKNQTLTKGEGLSKIERPKCGIQS